MKKQESTHSEGGKKLKSIGTDPEMAKMWVLAGRYLNFSLVNMFRDLKEKTGMSMHR